ncbi:MAG: GSCFA domain-containing protein [Flavobacteriaceae bacterium]|nr:GSCFA domain-containing protein [Flavobacteriaceae bacterium]
MKLTTEINIPKSKHPIDYHSKIMAFGSCFAEHMGAKFQYYKFQNTINPFGILFHPLAIEKVIHFALSENAFTENDIFFLNERWHCFDAHSQLSHPDKEVLLQNLNGALKIPREQLKESTHFILTLGTAWVYKHKKSGDIVANCHKVPQNEFEKQLLSITEIEESLHKIVEIVKENNPNISFTFTISPVRHLKDGFAENQRSKAHLIAALQSFLNRKITNPRVLSGAEVGDYFPSYEIQMDELRDYRFYAEDMVHPNQLAVDFIWERFSETYFTKETFATMKEVDTIQKGLAHKPFNPSSESHIKFIQKLENQMEQLQKKFGHIQF